MRSTATRTVAMLYLLSAEIQNQPHNARVLKESQGEYLLQERWKTIQNAEFISERGDTIRVITPGTHNPYGGPDFVHALIEINGHPYRGDVEIHQHVEDWYRHGHHQDPVYNHVILHVVDPTPQPPRPVYTAQGKSIPTVVWAYQPSPNAKPNPSPAPAESAPPCLTHPRLDYPLIVRILAQERVFRRVEQIRKQHKKSDLDQVFYELLFYGLGLGSRYAELYLHLAREIPFVVARRWAQPDPKRLEALYLSRIGLLQKGVQLRNPYALELAGLLETVSYEVFQNTASTVSYEPHSIRMGSFPPAQPLCRIPLMAELVYRCGNSLCNRFITLAEQTPPQRPLWKQWSTLFPTSHLYWSHYVSWDMSRLKMPRTWLSAKRIYSIIGNIIIPFLLYCIQEGLWGFPEEKLWDCFYSLPGEGTHRVIRQMHTHARHLFPNQHLRFFEQQALIQWHRHWCERHPHCVACPWRFKNPPSSKDFQP